MKLKPGRPKNKEGKKQVATTIDQKLYLKLKDKAKQNHRSISGTMAVILEQNIQ